MVPGGLWDPQNSSFQNSSLHGLRESEGARFEVPTRRVCLPHNPHVTSTQPRPTSLPQLGQGERRLGGRGKEPEPEPREDLPPQRLDWILGTLFLSIGYTNCHTAQGLRETANKHWSRAQYAGSCSLELLH